MEKMTWSRDAQSDGSDFKTTPLIEDVSKLTDDDRRLLDTVRQARENLLGSLSEVDDHFSETILDVDSLDKIQNSTIVNALRRVTIKQLALPVTIGSSYKNVGVQLLMDNVLKYLPSPLEKRPSFAHYYGDELCALAFKVIHDKMLGKNGSNVILY